MAAITPIQQFRGVTAPNLDAAFNTLINDINDRLTNVAAASYTIPTMYVMFLIAGQSNAQGMGVAASAPTMAAGMAYQYYNSVLSAKLSDPIGNANTGSAWPAFANAFYLKTGMGCIFVPAALTGTALIAAADTAGAGDWSPTGTLRGTAVTRTQAAMTAATAAGLAWQFGGVLWAQGETDAIGIAQSVPGVTQAAYLSGLQALKIYFEGAFSITAGAMPFCIFTLGTTNQAPSNASFTAIRNAQRQAAQADPSVSVVFTGAINFQPRGLMADLYHYTQAGYNEMGSFGAIQTAYVCAGRV